MGNEEGFVDTKSMIRLAAVTLTLIVIAILSQIYICCFMDSEEEQEESAYGKEIVTYQCDMYPPLNQG